MALVNKCTIQIKEEIKNKRTQCQVYSKISGRFFLSFLKLLKLQQVKHLTRLQICIMLPFEVKCQLMMCQTDWEPIRAAAETSRQQNLTLLKLAAVPTVTMKRRQKMFACHFKVWFLRLVSLNPWEWLQICSTLWSHLGLIVIMFFFLCKVSAVRTRFCCFIKKQHIISLFQANR